MATPSTVSRASAAGALALDAFARYVDLDPAVDSIVYDLAAYDPGLVDSPLRYVGISRDGIHGFHADVDAANFALVNRSAFPRPLLPFRVRAYLSWSDVALGRPSFDGGFPSRQSALAAARSLPAPLVDVVEVGVGVIADRHLVAHPADSAGTVYDRLG